MRCANERSRNRRSRLQARGIALRPGGCAKDILLAREAHFPATIADLYDPDTMPANLREAHERNDETVERIYIGRRFKNDTERLEKIFELYTQMTGRQASPKKPDGRKKKGADA
jgi:hypothetical protein